MRPSAVVIRGIPAWIGIDIGRIRILTERYVVARELVSVVQAEVHFGQEEIAGDGGHVVHPEITGSGAIVGHAIGSREIVHDAQGNGIEALFGNYIARKGLPQGCGWIEDWN